ncbi:CoA binding domain protein [mine drainage metagenome]|uniref:CoA binding domain protein n=1 Tax=mine drainage metagenome TaxID=410659 RepID=T1ATW4_9ZZZZ
MVENFYRIIREVNRIKPVVVLKSGRTNASAKAASLHTGAMATDDRIFDGMLRQAGVTRAYNEVELLDYSRILAHSKTFKGKNIAVITTAGGVGVITTDYISSSENGIGLNMAELSQSSKDLIKESIISFGSSENPIDLTADGSVSAYDSVLSILEEDMNVDAIIAYALPQTPKMNMGITDVISKHIERGKPIVVGVIGSKLGRELLIEFEKRKIPAYPSIERTVRSLKVLYEYGKYMGGREA